MKGKLFGSKRMIGICMVFVLVALALAGCSGGKKEEPPEASVASQTAAASTPASAEPSAEETVSSPYGDTGGLKLPIVDKPTTISWAVVSENPNLQDSLIVREIEKRTGITLDLQAYPAAQFDDKMKVILASGALPDITQAIPLSEANKLGGQGALAPINRYADQLPNFRRLYMDNEENNWVMRSYTDDNNDLYMWPIYGVSRDVNHGFMYRKDIFDQHGIPEWTTTEQFYEALKKLKEIYPDSVPYSSKSKEVIFMDWAYGWGIGGTQSPSYPAVYDEAAAVWNFAPTTPAYKEMLDFMQKLYSERLLDPEFLTDTEASWNAKLTTGKSFVTFDWIGRLELMFNQVKENNPNFNLRYANPIGPTGKIRTLPKVGSYGVHVTNNANKEVALKLLDYLASPSGSELVTIGVEGETFVWNDAGKPEYPELKDVGNVDITVLRDRYGLWLAHMYIVADPRSVYFNYTEKEQEAQDKMNDGHKYEPLDPILKFTDEENSIIAELQAELDKASKEFSARYVMTPSFGDKEWQEWLNNAEKLGVTRYIDVYTAAQKRY